MFEMKRLQPSASLRKVLVYLVKDSDGKTPVSSVSLVDGDVTIYKTDGTVVEPTSVDDQWSEYATASGAYTFTFAMTDLTDLGVLSLVVDPKANEDQTTAPDIRRFVKEILIVETVTTNPGMNIVEEGETGEVLVNLMDDDTDLVPQTGLAAVDNLPSLKILKSSGSVGSALGTWSELGVGLYKYESTGDDALTAGFFALFVEKTGVRTFIKDVQVVEPADEDTPDEIDTHKYRIPVRDELAIRAAHTKSPKVGPPKYVGYRPKKMTNAAGENIEGVERQQFEVEFYPKPDKEYVLEYRYRRRPEIVTETRKFPQGVHDHSETILAACFVVIEERSGVIDGPMRKRYDELLEQSKALNEAQETETGAPGGSIWPNELVADEDQTDMEIANAPGFNFLNLQRDVGGFVGYGTAPQSWSHEEEKRVFAAIQSGYKWFVLPYVVPSQKNYVHEWSFLTPLHSFSYDPDNTDGTYPTVPTNFASIIGDITLKNADTGWAVVKHRPEETVRAMIEGSGRQDGAPQMFCFRSRNSEREEGDQVLDSQVTAAQQNTQDWEIVFWPTPDQTYTYEFTYSMNPFPLRGDNVIPFGAPIHSETIKYGCIAAAEVDIKGEVGGPMFQQFIQCLEKSISFDERATGPQHLGYNGNRRIRGDEGFLRAIEARHCDRSSVVRYITD